MGRGQQSESIEVALDITSRQVEQVSLVLCVPRPLSKLYHFKKMSTFNALLIVRCALLLLLLSSY